MKCIYCHKRKAVGGELCKACSELSEIKVVQKVDALWASLDEVSKMKSEKKNILDRKNIPNSIWDIMYYLSSGKLELRDHAYKQIMKLSKKSHRDLSLLYLFAARRGYTMYLAKLKVQGWVIPDLEEKDAYELMETWNEMTTTYREKHGKSIIEEEVFFLIGQEADRMLETYKKRNPAANRFSKRLLQSLWIDLLSLQCWIYGTSILSERKGRLNLQ